MRAALRGTGRQGFSERELERLERLLAPLTRADSPFTAGEKPPGGAVLCEPVLVAEGRVPGMTAGGSLRAPPTRPRDDKPARGGGRENQTAPPREREDRLVSSCVKQRGETAWVVSTGAS